jgi:hypothetical protein
VSDRGEASTWIGNLLLTAAMGRGWMLLVGILSVLVITNLTAYVLLAALRKGQARGELKIKTPFLTITNRHSYPEKRDTSIGRRRANNNP